ncbi:MAG: hypothetical protein K6B71_00005 [Alphaproteobacteria bacterium]|nr:hypothetical protein [Alphaproteobacteria bacterium]
MKKTLLSVLAGLTVMGSEFADGPSVEDRKKLCQLLIDKGTHVWVEKTKACIPVNPCLSVDEEIKKAYCNTVFADVQVGVGQDRKLAEKWLEKHGYSVGPIIMHGSTKGERVIGDDYLAFKVDSGSNYIQFQFDDVSESVEPTRALGIAKGICKIYNGNVTDEAGSALTKVSVFCANIKSEDTCNEMLSFYKEFENRTVLTSHYYSDSETCQLYE